MSWKTPGDLKYAKSDEWVRLEGSTATLGISDYAQDSLNDIVFVELPEVGRTLNPGDSFGVVESVKAASDLYTPIGGEIIEVNSALADAPETINSDPYGKGWIVKLRVTDTSGMANLMDADAYAAYCESR
ncbi:glycine cleavage system protein GcvH [Anaerolineae bacterium CFX9]|jgi:glycine cleavage system H protein|nr:glycine cleavage system protein GcvH [Anaerolineae bacterium CFX9]